MKMRTLLEEDLLPYVQALKESRNIEFKSAFDWHDIKSRKIKEEVIKAIMALSNTPTGGVIILGIRENNKSKKKIPDGVSFSQISWIEANYEAVEMDIHKHCSEYPAIEFVNGSTDKMPGNKQISFMLIVIKEFTTRPIVCKENGHEVNDKGQRILIEGDMYGRSYNGGWASKKCSSRELEEILKLATDKSQKDLEIRGYVKIDQVKGLLDKLKKERSDYE